MATAQEIPTAINKSPRNSDRQRTWLALIFVAAVTFVLYCGTLSFEFVWDDGDQIINNPLIRSWHSLPRIFGSDLWFHTIHNQFYYRPLFVAWEILNFKVFGLKPWGWHLTTVLLHVLASCAVYWLARSLKIDHWTAVVAALIFGVHPIHVECASWISAGSDSMVAIFYIFAFIAYLRSRDQQSGARHRWQILSFVLLACALLTKEMAITFSLLVAVYEWLDRKDLSVSVLSQVRTSIRAAMPYLIITGGYFFLRRMALHGSAQLDPAYTSLDVILTLPLVLFTYLKLLFFPRGVTVGYYVPYVTSLDSRSFVFPVLALLAVTVLVWFWSSRKKDLKIGFVVSWLVLGLIPVLYIRLFAPGAGVRDRYIYLPSVGFALLIAVAIRSLRLRNGNGSRWVQIAAGAVLTIGLFAGSLLQQVYWASDLLLFYRAYSLFPHNNEGMAINLADALTKRREYGRAIPLLKQVVEENPNSGTAHAVLAKAYVRAGQSQDARKELDEALRISPELLHAPKDKSDVANLYGELREYQKALSLYNEVLQEEPDFYDALYNGGLTHLLAGDDNKAEELFLHAAAVAPNMDAPNYHLGRIYLRKSHPELAETYFRTALRMNPTGYGFHYWLGQSLAARGQLDEAKQEYAAELKLFPNNRDAIAQLGAASPAHQPQLQKQ